MILSVEAEIKVGKSTLAYTAPLPIVSFDFDMGAERGLYGTKYELFLDADIQIEEYGSLGQAVKLVQSIPPNGILVFHLPEPLQTNPEQLSGGMDLWYYFVTLAAEAQKSTQVQSIVVDTMSAARRIAADAHLEKLQLERNRQIDIAKTKSDQDRVPEPRTNLLQIEWGKPNDWTRDIYNTTKGARKNLVATHHLTDGYEDGTDGTGRVVRRATGKRVLEGLNRTYQFTDMSIRMKREQVQSLLDLSRRELAVTADILFCGYNLSLEGTQLINPTWDLLANRVSDSLGGRINLPVRRRD